jgi:hypothetical protein
MRFRRVFFLMSFSVLGLVLRTVAKYFSRSMRTHIVDTVCYLTKRRRLLGADCASLFLSLLFFGGILFLNDETWQRDKTRKKTTRKNGEAKTRKSNKR